eukprot:gene6010-256_t
MAGVQDVSSGFSEIHIDIGDANEPFKETAADDTRLLDWLRGVASFADRDTATEPYSAQLKYNSCRQFCNGTTHTAESLKSTTLLSQKPPTSFYAGAHNADALVSRAKTKTVLVSLLRYLFVSYINIYSRFAWSDSIAA